MGIEPYPSQREEPTPEATQTVEIARSASRSPDTLADLVARVCRQMHSIADLADRACGRVRNGKDES